MPVAKTDQRLKRRTISTDYNPFAPRILDLQDDKFPEKRLVVADLVSKSGRMQRGLHTRISKRYGKTPLNRSRCSLYYIHIDINQYETWQGRRYQEQKRDPVNRIIFNMMKGNCHVSFFPLPLFHNNCVHLARINDLMRKEGW